MWKLNTENHTGFRSMDKSRFCHRPVIVGFGPAGMFLRPDAGKSRLFSPDSGTREDVDSRTQKVEAFWRGGELNPESNVQFGEGGAGNLLGWKA